MTKTALVLALFLWSGTAHAFGGSEAVVSDDHIPAAAASVGYNTLTFSSNMASGDIDPDKSKASGYKWYAWNFFSSTSTPSVTHNSDGSVDIVGSINSAAQTTYGDYVGTSIGGGAYIEGKLMMLGAPRSPGQIAFWTMSLEHLVGLDGQQWAGQTTDYAHFIEPDIIEYMDSASPGAYHASLHDWYGVWGVDCGGNYCDSARIQELHVAPTLRNQWHKYGMLWVPATDTTSGYIQYYFDGMPVGEKISWTKYVAATSYPPVDSSKSWRFGVIDVNHLTIILGGGTDNPLRVKWVKVWQASDAGNLVK